MIRLIVKRGEVAEATREFFQERIQIGRVEANDLVLPATQVSRVHALLERRGGEWVLTDHSSLGTTHNSDVLANGAAATLKLGDRIGIFPFQLEVAELSALPGAPAPAAGAPLRWSSDPSDPEGSVTPELLQRLLRMAPFSELDQARFPAATPLASYLKYDGRLLRFQRGEVLIRVGDYGHSVFFIVSGQVRIIIGEANEKLHAEDLGWTRRRRRGVFSALAQWWRTPRLPEVRAPSAGARSNNRPGRVVQRLSQLDELLADPKVRTVTRGPGSLVGEIAAISRTPRTATVVADNEVLVLEIRWQGLRDIMNRAPALRQQIEEVYRQRLRETVLKTSPWFRGLSPEAMSEIIRDTVFASYGEYDWHTSYRKLGQVTNAARRLEQEPLIASQGDYLNGMFLVISGFVRVSERINHGERTVASLRENDHYGLDLLAHNWRQPEAPHALRHNLRAIGHVDLLIVPTALVEQYVLPSLTAAQLAELSEPPVGALSPGLFEFLVERRLINGTAAMVIDLDRCVRCDDCVRACASTHGGNPRFVRQGPIHGALMVANACMHCTDPVCLIGCPTGAIQRDRQAGQIVINDETCIGCGTCASSCPYSNIRMVPIQTAKGEAIPHFQQADKVQKKATKCDLCLDQLGGPACERACPHDALRRVDLGRNTGLTEWLRK